jgi:hypothetical protein
VRKSRDVATSFRHACRTKSGKSVTVAVIAAFAASPSRKP